MKATVVTILLAVSLTSSLCLAYRLSVIQSAYAVSTASSTADDDGDYCYDGDSNSGRES